MARLPRLSLAGQVHHLLQRGNNRQPIFVDDTDRSELLALIGREARQHGVAVHAYVLMPNHFHLLATPAQADGLPRWMQAVGRTYVRRFNQRHGRSGTLWDGRYRCALLQPGRHVLEGMVYGDLNPVREGLAASAADYAWSSHGHYAGLRRDAWLAPAAPYWALGNTPFAREAVYTTMVRNGLSSSQEEALTRSVLGGWALGDASFLASLQQEAPRRLTPASPGRPRKPA